VNIAVTRRASSGRIALLLGCAAALTGCSRRLELEPCRIADRSCQEDVYYAVLRLRGDGWDPFEGVPPIRTITAAEYRDELTPDQPAEPPPNEPPQEPKIDPWDVALRWLGLVIPTSSSMMEAVEDRVSRVAANYSSGTQGVTVIDHGGGPRNDRGDTQLLVHELVHAFQDNEVSIAPSDRTTDGDFANRALIEGEAVLYERLAGAELDRVPPQNIDWEGFYDGWIRDRRANLPAERSPFYAVSWFVYPLGADLLTRAWLQGGNAAVRELGDSFPRSGVGLAARHEGMSLHDPDRLDCQLEPPDDAFQIRGFDRFGALQLYAFLAGNDMHEPDAWRSALDWRDDRLWLYLDEDAEQVALSWRIRMSNADAADTVVSVARQLPNLRAERLGNDALIVGSGEELADWPGAVDCDR
jgi:hypothetical protein